MRVAACMLFFNHASLSRSMSMVDQLFSIVVDEFLSVYLLLDRCDDAFLLLQPRSGPFPSRI